MYVQKLQQSLSASIPNLPGTVNNKDTWTHVRRNNNIYIYIIDLLYYINMLSTTL
jgi:hypothetical protein